MFIDKRNEYPAERATKTREHHAELDYHNRRLQDKKKRISLFELFDDLAGDNHITGDKLGGRQSVGD